MTDNGLVAGTTKSCATPMPQTPSLYRMSRRLIPALFTLTLAVIPVSAQFGPMRYPGMGGRYPNGGPYPSGGSSSNPVHGPVETLTGSLRSISSTDLVLDAGDDRVILVQIAQGTKYLSTMGKVKSADFEPGDHVTVEASQDSNDHYQSTTITMNKKGTAEEKAAALQAASTSSPSGSGGSSSGSDDPDRPRLHRANSNGGDANAQMASADSPQKSTSSGSAESGGAGSGSDVSSSTPASSTSRRPAAQAQPISVPSTAERPSLSAEDVNGVTRAPVVAPAASTGQGGEVSQAGITQAGGMSNGTADDDSVIEQTREVAFSFSETLPNYTVKQFTNRYQTNTASRGGASWQALDVVTTDVVYLNGKESYTNILVNGKPTRDIESTGSWSEGEFASTLQALLSPGTNADFRNKRTTTIANRTAYRYDYTVQQARSTWTIHADGQTYQPSYTGAVWIDKESFRVLRIEIAARDMPRSFPLDTIESSIDYDFVPIGDQKVLLPVHSEALSCRRGTPVCSRNATDFRNYRKYTAESSITFEGTDK